MSFSVCRNPNSCQSSETTGPTMLMMNVSDSGKWIAIPLFFFLPIPLEKKFWSPSKKKLTKSGQVAHQLTPKIMVVARPQSAPSVCRGTSYIIQTLSTEPAFGSRLDYPIGIQLPTKVQLTLQPSL